MQITKGQLLQLINTVEPDPQLLTKIITDLMAKLPAAYSWQLAQQLYLEYYWDGDVITLTNNITGVVKKFGNIQDIYIYLKALGYKCTPATIRAAINDRRANYCNHTFDTKEKEITYL